MTHPAIGNMLWARRVNADQISERTGVPTEQLYIMNQDTAPDPLDLLIQQEDDMSQPQTITLTDNVNTIHDRTGILFTDEGLKTFKKKCNDLSSYDITLFVGTGADGAINKADVMQNFPTQPNGTEGTQASPDPSIPIIGQPLVLTEALRDMLDEDMQRSYSQMVRGSLWVATMLDESRDFDFIPDIDQTRNAAAQAITGVSNYAYNGAVTDQRDPSRKSLSDGQWNMLESNAETVLRAIERINILKGAGFIPHHSFEEEYDVARSDRMKKQNERAEQERLRAQRNENAMRNATEQVKSSLEGLL